MFTICRGGSQIQAGIWYDITMKVYMKEQVITAWVGDEPIEKTYAPFANSVDYFQRILFGLTGSDTPWGPQETGGIRVDDLHITNAEGAQEFKELPYFSDIDQHSAKNDIEFLERKDVIAGSVDQIFHPDQPIQAEEFIAWTVKAFRLSA